MQTDLRIRYTHQVITEAYIQLLRQKPAERITVKEVCERAQINRSTFYRQFKDCFDLLEQLEAQALDVLDGLLRQVETQGAPAVLAAALAALRGSDDLLGILASRGADEKFVRALVQRCFAYIETQAGHMAPAPDSARRAMRNTFLAAGTGGVIEYWLRSGAKEPPEQVAAAIYALCTGAVREPLPG